MKLDMEKLLHILQSVDTVKFILTGVGEESYNSREVYEAIRPFVKNYDEPNRCPNCLQTEPNYYCERCRP